MQIGTQKWHRLMVVPMWRLKDFAYSETPWGWDRRDSRQRGSESIPRPYDGTLSHTQPHTQHPRPHPHGCPGGGWGGPSPFSTPQTKAWQQKAVGCREAPPEPGGICLSHRGGTASCISKRFPLCQPLAAPLGATFLAWGCAGGPNGLRLQRTAPSLQGSSRPHGCFCRGKKERTGKGKWKNAARMWQQMGLGAHSGAHKERVPPAPGIAFHPKLPWPSRLHVP